MRNRTWWGAFVVACGMTASCATSGMVQPARGVGPSNMIVTSPMRTYEDAPYASFERSDTRMSRRGGGPFTDDGREAPGLFLARTRLRVEDLEARIREGVQRESLAYEAAVTVVARGRNVMAAAHAAAQDGVITAREKEQVSTLLRDAEREASASVPIARAWSGGSAYWR